MIHMVDPRQNRLFDPFLGAIPAAGQRIIAEGWQGVFRHAVLESMPVSKLAENFSRVLGAPTKELYSMAGLVFLADFFGWTVEEAVEAYIFRSDVQYALNLEPGVAVSTRTVERYQRTFRENELATGIFRDVTTRLAEKLELDISCQRLDSTHVFSRMASFGRTKLMAVAIKRFLTQVRRHDFEVYTALPEEFRRRYEPTKSQLFSGAKDAETRQRAAAGGRGSALDHRRVLPMGRHDRPLERQGIGHDFQPAVRTERRQSRGEGRDWRGLHAEPVRPQGDLRCS
jgi:hypothetical protein